MADTVDSKSTDRKIVGVRIPPRAPTDEHGMAMMGRYLDFRFCDGGAGRSGPGSGRGLSNPRARIPHLLRTLMLVATIVLAGCSWPQFGHDAAHSGTNPSESTLTIGNVGALTQVWSATNGPITSTPVTADGLVYIGAANSIFAYDTTGTVGCSGIPKVCIPKWRSGNLGGAIVGSPAVVNGVVYATGVGEKLFAFDAKGGNCNTRVPPGCAPIWTALLGGEAFSAPTVANGFVYVTSIKAFSQQLAVFDAAGTNGCAGTPKVCTPLWTASAVINGSNGAARSAPAVADGRVYMTVSRSAETDDGPNISVAAYDAVGQVGCSGAPKVCEPLWQSSALGDPVSSPSIDHGVLYAFDGEVLSALDATGTTNCSGTPKICTPLWTSVSRPAFPLDAAGVAVTGGVVYAGTAGSAPGAPVGLAAFDATGVAGCTGTPIVCSPLWTSLRGSETAPAVANGVVYVTDTTGISAIDAHGIVNCSGVPKVCLPVWTAAGPFAASSPSVVNGRVYVGGTDGLHVFAQP